MRKMMRFLLAVTFVYFTAARAQTGTACPMLACAINCTYSQKLDANGCRTCECLDPCKDKVCPLGEECRVEKELAVCVKKECPLLKCRACNSGYRLNYNGCQTCSCVDPCEYHKCEEGQVCTKKEVQCIIAPCYKVANCTACPQIRCFAPCKSGYRVDSNKCQTCSCVDPCEYPKCEEGQVCTSKEVQCIRAPCYPVADCTVPVCPQIRCFVPCKSGYREDSNKCQTCSCVDPCEYPKCEEGQVCTSKEVQCIRAPCYKVANCTECPLYKCAPCNHGYKVDKNGCQTCDCLPPRGLNCGGKMCSKGQICKKVVAPCLVPPCPVIRRCYNTTSV